MSQTTVRITESAHALLKHLAKEEERPMQAVLEEALEEHRRRRFLQDVNAGYAAARGDRAEYASFVAESAEWNSTNLDGLDRGRRKTLKPRRKRS
jgi:predicted transcriptional regulator